MIEILTLSVTGIFVGFIAGLFGIGGGLIIVPVVTYLLIHFHGMNHQLAFATGIGSSMMSIIFTGLVATFFNYKNKNLNTVYFKKHMGSLIVGSFIGGILVIYGNYYYLKVFFVFYCFFAAIKLLTKINLLKPIYCFPEKIIGIIFGLISSLVGIGGGTLYVPYLVTQKLNIRESVSSASMLGVVIAISTLLCFFMNNLFIHPITNNFKSIFDYGYIYVPSLIFLTLPSLLSIYFSTKLLITINEITIKRSFALLLIIIGCLSFVNL
ncbi:MAG: sulfite exporter TauE/SafE family protein [Methylophilaceae bacterium]